VTQLTTFKDYMDQEAAELASALAGMGVDGQEVKALAVRALDQSALVLAADMRGESTLVAKVSLRATYANLRATSSVVIAGFVAQRIEQSMVRVIGLLSRTLLSV
jgi:hypothetical protein